MNTDASTEAPIRFSSGNLISAGKAYFDPLLIMGCLVAISLLNGQRIDGKTIILAVLAFALTFPGSIPFRYRQRGLIREIAASWSLVMAMLFGLGYATSYIQHYDRDVIYQWALFTPVIIWVGHLVSPYVLSSFLTRQEQKKAIVIGANDAGMKVSRNLSADEFLNTRVEGFFDDRSPDRLSLTGFPSLLGRMGDVAKFVQTHRVDQIYIALPMSSQPRILNLLDELRDTTASVYFVPDIFMFDLIQARVDEVNGVPVIAVCDSPFHGTTGLIKRISDVVLSSCILILIAPLLVAIAIAVKATSRGPIIFRQTRYGLDSREIVVWKFRTMYCMENGPQVQQATKNDPRLTPIGGFLRKTSLDELPQFINVLQGRMSIVGPRPHAVSHNEMYRRVIKGYMVRHKVKPGITGLAQINGARGETDTLDKMQKRIEYDLEYLRNWSLRLDLSIVLRTVPALLGKDNSAY